MANNTARPGVGRNTIAQTNPGSCPQTCGRMLKFVYIPGRAKMSQHSETPFDNIESAHEYVKLLAEAVEVAITEIEADIADADKDGADSRRVQALQLVLFNLTKLSGDMNSSRKILNDLRTLRRLLLEERTLAKVYRQAAG